MRFRGVGRIHLLAGIMVALAALNPISQRIAVAQIPDAPESFTDSNGGALSAPGDAEPMGEGKRDKRAPNPALETIDEFQRARERASGTPEPEPTQRGGFLGTE